MSDEPRWCVEPAAGVWWLVDCKFDKMHWRDSEFEARMECAARNAKEEEKRDEPPQHRA